MRYFLTAQWGIRVSLEDFSRVAVSSIGGLDAMALEVLCRARMSEEATNYPEVVELVDAILAAPRLAGQLVQQTSVFGWQRFCVAFALAYVGRYTGVSLAVEPEDAGDEAHIASVHDSPVMVQ